MSKLQLLAISAIIVDEIRQRETFTPEAMAALQKSISEQGLLHPVVVEQIGENQYKLLAGERRLRSIKAMADFGMTFSYAQQVLDLGYIPATVMQNLTELQRREIEWEENAARTDLTWQEKVKATKALQELRGIQAAETGGVFDLTALTKEITGSAEVTPQQKAQVASEIKLAEAIEKNPEVAAAKSKRDAEKILKNQEKRQEQIEAAVRMELVKKEARHFLFRGSCLQWMNNMENHGKVDVIITDPPYGMNAQNFGDSGGKMDNFSHQYNDTPEHWRELMTHFCRLTADITKPEAHAYIFCDIDRFTELREMMQAAGWQVFRTPLIQFKGATNGRVPWPETGFRRTYEIMLYAVKGNKPVNTLSADVMNCLFESNEDKTGHGAQKPVSLFVELMRRSCKAGDVVFDGFAGSGTVFTAADRMNMYSIGCEIEEQYIGQCVQRLEAIEGKIKLEI